MPTQTKISIFWYRRDLRLEDNRGLNRALQSGLPVLPIFIFDQRITDGLPADDARISFIYKLLSSINAKLQNEGSGIQIFQGNPMEIWKDILRDFDVANVYTNEDYEPYAIQRDKEVQSLLNKHGIEFHAFKDQVIFAKNEIVKDDGTAYKVFTPFKRRWLAAYPTENTQVESLSNGTFCSSPDAFPTMEKLGFQQSKIEVRPFDIDHLANYDDERNIPAIKGTSDLSPHLRFGSVSVRSIVHAVKENEVFLSELIWREFFMQILWHYPDVVSRSFKPQYDKIQWRNNEQEFENWKAGKTGYPIVDAGMRELNRTGYMHNRVRMIVASFLCKHLLIDWRWGEAYFAEKLLDFELSSNNGNWQWCAGTGSDSAPYFRVFNPTEQTKKFDGQLKYINKWVPELNSLNYPPPMVEHKFARNRALETYKEALNPA